MLSCFVKNFSIGHSVCILYNQILLTYFPFLNYVFICKIQTNWLYTERGGSLRLKKRWLKGEGAREERSNGLGGRCLLEIWKEKKGRYSMNLKSWKKGRGWIVKQGDGEKGFKGGVNGEGRLYSGGCRVTLL